MSDELPIADSHEHDTVWCEDCEQVVALTMDWDDQQSIRYECHCSAIPPTVKFPDSWRNTFEGDK